ncbi:MAG: hypothetical protein LHV68_13275 [Elusimicrobia bacterium]|nr:hypothetical protein [Candidatus Liberimonas magnetica]
MKKLVLITGFLLLNLPGGVFCGAVQKKLPNIIVITIDGVRNSETINDPSHQFIPILWNSMFKEGVLYKNLKALPFTFHTPAYISICTGKEYEFCWAAISSTSIFTYIGEKYNLPKTKIWSIGHYPNVFYDDLKLKYPSCLSYMFGPRKMDIGDQFVKENPELAKEFDKNERMFLEKYIELRKKNILVWPDWDSNMEVLYGFANKIINFYKPVFLYYVMSETETGHYDTYARYVLGLKGIDKRILGIWNLINTDPYYKENTYLFVNVDHSRDENYMEHDKAMENVWLYVYGPGIKKGITIGREINSVDIFATLAYIMDVKTEKSDGKVLYDIFEKDGLHQ